MNNIKLIALDLDGTLLRSDDSLSEYNLAIWKKVQELGIHIMPATGRSLISMQRHFPYDICEYSINCNGVDIFFNNKGSVEKIQDLSIDRELALQILHFITKENPDVHVHVYVGEHLYAMDEKAEVIDFVSNTEIRYNVVKNWDAIPYEKVQKIMIFDDHEKLVPFHDVFNEREEVHAVFSLVNYLEVFNRRASKGEALWYLIKKLGLKREEVLAVGDSFNDEAMLEFAGKAFVMNNASPKLCPHLPRTEYNNNEDGIGKLLVKELGLS